MFVGDGKRNVPMHFGFIVVKDLISLYNLIMVRSMCLSKISGKLI